MTLRDLLGLRPKADTAADLRTSLTNTETALASVRDVIATMEEARGAILLDGSPTEAEAHERKLAELRSEAERLSAIATTLPARIATAEAREQEASLDQLAEQAEAKAAEGAALLPRIIRDWAALADLMRQHDALTEEVHAANRQLRRGGREPVDLPMRRLWPDPKANTPAVFGFDKAAAGHGGGTVFAGTPGNAVPTGTLAGWLAAKAAQV
ncbi:MAG TPA: hypothetical protein VD932_01095 [Aquabacterium sp.]|nr:hypothetical protein [Aquabacterium sp.]